MTKPEEQARKNIDNLLAAAGWCLQNRDEIDLNAARGIAVREFPLKTGFADYLLFVDRRAVGAVEAKAEGITLSGVEVQSAKYSAGLPNGLPAPRKPLPFLYESTGVETFFTSGLDPDPRSRRTFAFHKPETLAEWLRESSTLRKRFRQLPPLITDNLWQAQIEAITNLEASLAQDRPRALIQMATGSGKTFVAINAVYRLIKFAQARRVLFLVDRSNLGRQALNEFQQFTTPDDGRKFTELYNVQRLTSNVLDPVCKVHITTIQRLFSILCGEPEYDPEDEERSLFDLDLPADLPEKQVRYNSALPIEYYDIIIVDECHRSIYNLWRQVLEYFDAHLIGLTATPSKQTFGFFNQNLVMEYSRQRAVVDGVNVDGQVYRIRTQITEQGSHIEAGFQVDRRDRKTRAIRWETLDDDLEYIPPQLDASVVAEDQIRTIIRTFRDRLATEIFRGREEVPKTLIFAKDDSHAEDIVRIVREEFGRGNEFCKKITYRVTGVKAEDLITDFRNSYNPRIAVTVDMIATGTDIKPIECLLFMRMVKSANLFEQMLGRGTRVINPTDLEAVTPGAREKTRFVIVDAVGVVETLKVDTQTLERKRMVGFEKLLESLALGMYDEDSLSSLAGRLARLNKKLTERDEEAIAAASGGRTLHDLARTLLDAIDPDKQLETAQTITGQEQPSEEQIAEVAGQMMQAAADLFKPELRRVLIAIHERDEQTIDRVSQDVVLEAAFSEADTERARAMVASFRQFIEQHRDEIGALQILYNQPYGARLTLDSLKELAEVLKQAPRGWTAEALWGAFAQTEPGRVRLGEGKRLLTDLIALVRHALQPDSDLLPYPEQVRTRYDNWLAQKTAEGYTFTPEQRRWLERIANHIAVNLGVTVSDLEYGEFFNDGGRVRAMQLFGRDLPALLDELNAALAA